MPKVGAPVVLPVPSKNPFWMTPDKLTVKLYHGHVLERLRLLPANSVHCVITSPPYWGLRDYKTEPILWEDGWLGSYGNEPTPDMFVAHTVSIFREVRRVLRDDGTLFLNLGDTYGEGGNLVGIPWRVALSLQADGWILRQDIIWHKPSPMPESVRNRCTKAHEYVFLFAKKQGYYFDAEAIKESQSDKTVKGPKPFGRKAMLEGAGTGNMKEGVNYESGPKSNKRAVWTVDDEAALLSWMTENAPETLAEYLGDKEYKGDTWRIASSGYPGAHFATYPPRLIEPMIKAGTSEKGCCVKCGAPWKRLTKKEKLKREWPNDYVKRVPEPTARYKALNEENPNITHGFGSPNAKAFKGSMQLKPAGSVSTCANSVAGVAVETLGWEPTCKCGVDRTQPCIVLDPFVGSGTTAATCIGLGRRSWGIELSETYLRENAIPRIEKALASLR